MLIFKTLPSAVHSEVLGLLLLFTFGFMACGLAAIRQSIKQATGCVRVAVECVFSMPTMMLTPCFEAIRAGQDFIVPRARATSNGSLRTLKSHLISSIAALALRGNLQARPLVCPPQQLDVAFGHR